MPAKWLKSIPYFMTKDYTLWVRTYLCSPYKGVLPPGVPPFTEVWVCKGVALWWTSIPSRGEQKYSKSLHATETRISSAFMSHLQLARMGTSVAKNRFTIKQIWFQLNNGSFSIANISGWIYLAFESFLKFGFAFPRLRYTGLCWCMYVCLLA